MKSLYVILIMIEITTNCIGQDWHIISPVPDYFGDKPKVFKSVDGYYELYFYTSFPAQNYRLNHNGEWDSIFTNVQFICKNRYNSYGGENLIDFSKPSVKSRRLLSLFVKWCDYNLLNVKLYLDTNGNFSLNNLQHIYPYVGMYHNIEYDPNDSDKVFLCVKDSLYSSHNGGHSFLSFSKPDTSNNRITYFSINPHLTSTLFVYSDPYLSKSSDGGLSWKHVLNTNYVWEIKYHQYDTSLIYIATSDGLFKSTNQGDTWSTIKTGFFYTIDTDSNNTIFAGNVEGELWRSTNGGNQWQRFFTYPGSSTILSVTKLPRTDSLIVVNCLAIYKGSASILTDIVTSTTIPSNFILHQNYPNPFNPSTKINYELPSNCKVKLIIYNVLGQEIITLVDDYQTAGYYSFLWSGKNKIGLSVSNGLYIYKFVAYTNEQIFNKSLKMLLLK